MDCSKGIGYIRFTDMLYYEIVGYVNSANMTRHSTRFDTTRTHYLILFEISLSGFNLSVEVRWSRKYYDITVNVPSTNYFVGYSSNYTRYKRSELKNEFRTKVRRYIRHCIPNTIIKDDFP